MKTFEIKRKSFALTVDAENVQCKVTLKSGKEWTMTKRPYILFSSGEIVEFPKPYEVKATKSGTYDGVRSFFDISQKNKLFNEKIK